MTQFYSYAGFSLRRAPLHVRLLVSAFLLLASAGVGVGMVNYQVRTGLSAAGSGAWYRGGVLASAAPEAGDDGFGAADTAAGGRTPLELLDATHPHLFNQAFLFFLLGHLVALCAVPSRLKTGLYAAGFAAVLIDAASPWLIAFGAPAWAWLQLGGHLLLAGSFGAMVLLPMREMWLRSGGTRP